MPQNTRQPIATAIVVVGTLLAAAYLFSFFIPEIFGWTIPDAPGGMWQCIAGPRSTTSVTAAYPTSKPQVWRLEHANPIYTCAPMSADGAAKAHALDP
jgi:hypothetical protein